MAVSETFLASCRDTIADLAELTAWQAAYTAYQQAPARLRLARWHEAYSDGQDGLSPAYRLRRAIRDVIAAQAEADGITSQAADLEAAYRTLEAQYVKNEHRPLTPAEEDAAMVPLAMRQLID